MSNGNIISAYTSDNHSIFIDAFHNLLLPVQFAVVYLDVNFATDKLGTAQKEDLHILIGITLSGEKYIIDYGIYSSESTLV